MSPSSGLQRAEQEAADFERPLDRLIRTRTNGGLPLSLYRISVALARPGRHGNSQRRQRLAAEGAELKVSGAGNGDADAEIDRDGLLAAVLLAPHLTLTAEEEPDFFDRSVRHRDRSFSRGEFKM